MRKDGTIDRDRIMTVVVQRTTDCEGTQKMDETNIGVLQDKLKMFMKGCLVVKGIRIVFTTHPFKLDGEGQVVVNKDDVMKPLNTITVSTDVAYYIFETNQIYVRNGGKVF